MNHACPRCGTVLSASAAFCLQCGHPANGSVSGSRLPKWLPFVTGVLILAGVTWSLSKAGLIRVGGAAAKNPQLAASGETNESLSLGGERNGSVLTVPGEGANSALAIGGSQPSPSLTVEGQQSPPSVYLEAGMPADVYNWLKHLRETERRRFAAIDGAKDPSMEPNVGTAEKVEAERNRRIGEASNTVASASDYFRDLIQFFRSVPPPEECRPIATEYNAALDEILRMTSEIEQGLATMDVDRLLRLQGQSVNRIDARIRAADDLVDGVCREYGVPNEFRLSPESGASVAAASDLLKGAQKAVEDMMRELSDDGG